MDEVLSWAEIQRRYADEWVLLADPEMDEAFPVSSGRVVFHSKDRAATEATTVDPPVAQEGIFFTGELCEAGVAYIL